MKSMRFKHKPRRIKLGIIVSIVLPLFYIVPLIITKDPDFIVFALGPFGFIVWIVQWITFLIAGWILAIIATILLFAVVGYFSGALIG